MKRKIVLATLLATSLFAKTELSMSVGSNSFDGDEGLKNSTTFGVRGDFYLDNIYHLDVGYTDLGDNHFKDSLILDSINIKRFYTQFSADGEEEYHVVPTLSIGLGLEQQKADSNTHNTSFLSLCVGFRYNISNNLNFLLGTKALWKTKSRDINYHTNFGIGYMIDSEPVNNKSESIDEVVVPQKELQIPQTQPQVVEPQVVVPKEQIQQAPVVVDAKQVAVNQVQVVKQPQVVLNTPQPVPTEVPMQKPVVQKRSGVFIQVAAYAKSMPKNLLERLSKKHHIVLRHQGKLTKALVGPYSSRYVAQKILPSVRRVAPRAFIYKGN